MSHVHACHTYVHDMCMYLHVKPPHVVLFVNMFWVAECSEDLQYTHQRPTRGGGSGGGRGEGGGSGGVEEGGEMEEGVGEGVGEGGGGQGGGRGEKKNGAQLVKGGTYCVSFLLEM